MRIETSCGTINPTYVRDQKIRKNFYFPEHGVKILIDGNANYNFELNSLNDILKFSKFNIRHSNNFFVKNRFYKMKNTQEQTHPKITHHNFYFAHDPTDFICSDNIEKLKKYFPCYGKKGILSIID